MAAKKCTVEGCDRPHNCRNLCQMHYDRWRKKGDPQSPSMKVTDNQPIKCSVPDCEQWAAAKGYCGKHYWRFKKHGDPSVKKRRLYDGKPGMSRQGACAVPECGKAIFGKGHCQTHYYRLMKHGDPLKVARIRERARGEGTFNNGYHFKSVKINGRIRQVGAHRLVMEQKLGRPLRPNENVHHINGNRSDNRPENLELWVRSQPCGQRPADLIAFAREIIATYGSEVASASG